MKCALTTIALYAFCLASHAAAPASCPFVSEESERDALAQTETTIAALRKSCRADEQSPFTTELTKLASIVASIRERLRPVATVPENLVGDGIAGLTCHGYASVLANQRGEALRRLQYEMRPPEDAKYAQCFTQKGIREKIDCIHQTANERLHDVAKLCGTKKSQAQEIALRASLADAYKFANSALPQLKKRLPEDCREFAATGATVANQATQLTTSLSTTLATLQSTNEAAGIGIVMAVDLLRFAYDEPQHANSHARFKRSMEFPANACVLFDLQQRQLACDQQKPGVTPPRRGLAAESHPTPGAVQDVLNAMKATDAQSAATQGVTILEGNAEALDKLSDFLLNRIANPSIATKSGDKGRVQTLVHLRQISADLRSLALSTSDAAEKLGLEQMATKLSELLTAYAKYKEARATAGLRMAQEELWKRFLDLLTPVLKKDEYRHQSLAGLREILDRHWEMQAPADGTLTQLRRHEYVQTLLRPIEHVQPRRDDDGSNYTAARNAFLDDIVRELQEQRKELNSKRKLFEEEFVAMPNGGILKTNFELAARPLLTLCTSLASSFNATPNSAAIYRSACEVFHCGGHGLPIFDPANSADATQELAALQCKNVHEAKRWEAIFEGRFTNPKSPGELCESAPKTEPFFDSLRKKLWNNKRGS